jgi:hypothetical protein
VVERGAAEQPYQSDYGECPEKRALRESIFCGQDRCPVPLEERLTPKPMVPHAPRH